MDTAVRFAFFQSFMAFGTQRVVRFSDPPPLPTDPRPLHQLTTAPIHVLTKVNVFLSSRPPCSPAESVADRRRSLNVSFCLKTCLFCRLGPASDTSILQASRPAWVTDHRQIRTTVNAAYRRRRTWTQTPIKPGLSMPSQPSHPI